MNTFTLMNIDSNPITEITFSTCRRLLFISCDNGNIYVLSCSLTENKSSFADSFLAEVSIDDPKLKEIRKNREMNGFKGFSITDSLALINNESLNKVNEKIDKLNLQIKNLVTKYKDELKKITKRCEKHKKTIKNEIDQDIQKQDAVYQEVSTKNADEISNLKNRRDDDLVTQKAETDQLMESKERLLDYVTKENDDLENEISNLNENLINELEKVKDSHQSAINQLKDKIEKSMTNMINEITSTVKKLKENASYFETVLKEQEDEYEHEISSLDHTKRKNEKQEEALKEEQEVKRAQDDLSKMYKVPHDRDRPKPKSIDEMKKLVEEYAKTCTSGGVSPRILSSLNDLITPSENS